MKDEELTEVFPGNGWKPYFVEGYEQEAMHQLMAGTLDTIVNEIRSIQDHARSSGDLDLPTWPMVILRSPKGWTGPKIVDGKPIEGTWRAHQVPVADLQSKPEHVKILEHSIRSYRPEQLFDQNPTLLSEP